MIFYAAKAIIYDTKGNIILGKRTITQCYEPLGGTLQGTETFEEALHREILEEAGIEIEILGYIGGYRFQWYTEPKNTTICILYNAMSTQEPKKQPNCSELEIIPHILPFQSINSIRIHPLQNEFRKLLIEFA